MQHKRSRFRWIVPAIVVIALVGGLVVFMGKEPPAPTQVIEKQLDAKALLGTQ